MSTTRRTRTRGVSTAELLVGATLGLVGLGALYSVFSAQQKLEELRSMPLGAAALATGVYDDPANPMRPDGSAGGVFSRRWTVSPSDTPRSGLKTVVVAVSWPDYTPHTTRVAAYVRCSTIPCS